MIATFGMAFGVVAALLSGIGLYGVIAFSMQRRTREIGLRIALGAQPRNVTWLAMREAVTLFAVGAALAIPAALALARLIEAQLYGVTPFDLRTLAGAVVLMATVAGLAALVPALRAARTQPMTALRFE
ncbi:MAG: FtsX-like permease family protein [Bryobacterales bacterium]